MCSGNDSASQTGNLIALSEGIFFALMTVSAKKVAGTNPIGLTAVANLFTGILVFLLFPGSLNGLSVMTITDWVVMLILGVVQIGAGYACYNMGIQKISAQKASVIALWEMILGPVWVALFLHEYPAPWSRLCLLQHGDSKNQCSKSFCNSSMGNDSWTSLGCSFSS